MWNPAQFAIDRPRIIVLTTMMLIAYGWLSFQELPRQENPTLEDRVAAIRVYLPGADPKKIELLVTRVIEDAVSEVDDIAELSSLSSHGVSFVLAQVSPQSDSVAFRLQEIREKVQEVRALLPRDASEPEIDLRTLRTNTLILALTSPGLPPQALRERSRDLKRRLEELSGVRRVELRGLPEEEIRVSVDLHRLSQHGLPFEVVSETVARRNVRLPSGQLKMGSVRSDIQTTGAFDVVEEIEGTFLPAAAEFGRNPGQTAALPMRVGDVARVERRLQDPQSRVRYQGIAAVSLGVEMVPGYNAVKLGEQVRELLQQVRPQFPPGMDIAVVADEPTYVSMRLSLLGRSLLLGLALVVSLSVLGMGWRTGLVVSISIPLAMTIAIAVQGVAGLALHQISIAALVIAIGIVVDEAIVVADSIQRHLDQGHSPREAAIRGVEEIHLAVLAGAATTVAAFIPLMIMAGDIGDFVRSIPLVVSIMLIGSVVVAHFVTPLLSAWIHSRFGGKSSRASGAARLDRIYRPVIDLALRRPATVLATAAGTVVLATLGMAGSLWPPAFFPDADRHQFLIEVSLPATAPFEETLAVVEKIESRLDLDMDLLNWTSFVGTSAPKFYYNEFDTGFAENSAQFIVNTRSDVPFRRTREVVARVNAALKRDVTGASIRVKALKQGYGGGADIAVFVMGDDLDVLRTIGHEVREIIDQVPGVANAWDSFGYDPVTIQAEVDGARASLLGISHEDVARTLRASVDGVTATTFLERDQEIPIRVRLEKSQRANTNALATLPVSSPVTGSMIPLAQVARLIPGWSSGSVHRYARKREAAVRADLEPGASLLAVSPAIEAAVRNRISMPPGYEILFNGQRREVMDSFISLLKAALLAVFLIYIILVLRFGSLVQPILILLAVPMAVFGSCLGLVVTGNVLSFMAILGMIALTGIAVNDSIVMVDAINRRRKRGMPLPEAVRDGARSRVRAVLMTSITTIGGLIPLSVSGGEFWSPFGFAMIFGLGAATVLTLGIQPTAYMALERLRQRRSRREPSRNLIGIWTAGRTSIRREREGVTRWLGTIWER